MEPHGNRRSRWRLDDGGQRERRTTIAGRRGGIGVQLWIAFAVVVALIVGLILLIDRSEPDIPQGELRPEPGVVEQTPPPPERPAGVPPGTQQAPVPQQPGNQ